MSKTLAKIKRLALAGQVRISEHGYEELANDGLTAREILAGLERATVVENYPDYPKGASVLACQYDVDGQAIHVVWGIPKGYASPAVLVTAYRPDPALWNPDFTERKP